jgi:FHS family L-fucose permease-like MFS transporter
MAKSLFRTPDGQNHAVTFALVTTLFFTWGFCNGLLDILNKHFQDALHISKAHSAFVQSANFIGYFVMALPAGFIARRFGYKGGILLGLGLIAFGAFWFMPATYLGTYSAFLAGLFILAMGLACLETIANPYTTVLGAPESSATRINLAQSFNAVGTILAPWLGGLIVFSSGNDTRGHDDTLYIPYLGVGVMATILAVIFALVRLPDLKAEQEMAAAPGENSAADKPLWQRWHFLLGVVAQFLYVGAQVGINSFFINYMLTETPRVAPGWMERLPAFLQKLFFWQENGYRVTTQGTSTFLAVALVFFLLGRLFGSNLLRFTRAHATLAVFAAVNTGLMLLIIVPFGWISVGALFLCFFFMSIMFPTIFALGIRGLGDHTKLASSVIVMSIVGGAFLPLVMGWLADEYSIRLGFLMPLFCFAFVLLYALAWPWLEKKDAGHTLAI